MAENLNNQMKTLTLEKLHALKFKIEQELLERSQQDRACVIEQIKVLCNEYDISAIDLRGGLKESPTPKKKLKKSPKQNPIKQALDVITQGREYIKEKEADLNSCINQNYVDLYAVDVVQDYTTMEKLNALSDIRARLAAADSKRQLVTQIDSAKQQQLNRLNTVILQTIETGKLTSRELKTVLTLTEFDDYESRCNAPSPNDVYAAGVPSFFDNYISYMKQADLFNASADKLASARKRTFKNGKSSAELMRNKAERLYEKAIECIEELHGTADWDVAQQWLDRDVNFVEHGKAPSPCVVEVPRLRNSKSPHVRMGLPKSDKYLKKRLAAIETLCVAIETIIYEPDTYVTPSSSAQSKSLCDLINNIDDDLNF